MRGLLPVVVGAALLAGCGSSKSDRVLPVRFDPAKVTACLRAHADSFAAAGGGVVRLNLNGDSSLGTLAEIDVAFAGDSAAALRTLRAHYFFKTRPKARPFVHGRYVGDVAYAITTLPFLGGRGTYARRVHAAQARLQTRARGVVESCLAESRR